MVEHATLRLFVPSERLAPTTETLACARAAVAALESAQGAP